MSTVIDIGYDIDGVMCQDLAVVKLETLMNRINYLPLFDPPHPWVAITERTPIERDATFEWCRRYFNNPPSTIYFNEHKSSNIIQHKVDTILQLKLITFIESCPHQTKIIQAACPEVSVIHFSDMIKKALMMCHNTK